MAENPAAAAALGRLAQETRQIGARRSFCELKPGNRPKKTNQAEPK